MAQLKEVFKTREEICLWLEKNKTALEEKVGFKMQFTSTVELGILAEIEDSKDLKIISIPDFELLEESLKMSESFIRGEIGDEKYAGTIILAGNINEKFDKYLIKLQYISKLFRVYILEVDEQQRPVFKEYEAVSNIVK
ncbi:MAG: hypothetical protein WCK67_13415 [bacterium]